MSTANLPTSLPITDEAGTVTGAFIDKESFLTVKTTAKVNQMGQEMEVESYITEYMDVNGVKFAKGNQADGRRDGAGRHDLHIG